MPVFAVNGPCSQEMNEMSSQCHPVSRPCGVKPAQPEGKRLLVIKYVKTEKKRFFVDINLYHHQRKLSVITFTPHKWNSWETTNQRLKAPSISSWSCADFKGQASLAATCRFYQGGTFTLCKAKPFITVHRCNFTSRTHSLPPCYAGTQVSINYPCGWYHQGRELTSSSFFFTPYCLSTLLVCLISLRALPSRLSFQRKHKIAVAPLAGIKLFVIYPPNKIFVHPKRNTLTFCSTRSNFWF